MPVISTLQHLKGYGRRIAMNDVRIELKNGALFQKLRQKAWVRRMCRIGCETLRWEDFKASLGCICQFLPCTCPHPHRLVQVLWFPIHVIIGARARLESGTLEFAFVMKPLVIWGSNITLCPSFLWRMTLTWVTWSSTTWRRTSCEPQPSLQTSLLGSRQFSSREGSAQRLLLAFRAALASPGNTATVNLSVSRKHWRILWIIAMNWIVFFGIFWRKLGCWNIFPSSWLLLDCSWRLFLMYRVFKCDSFVWILMAFSIKE